MKLIDRSRMVLVASIILGDVFIVNIIYLCLVSLWLLVAGEVMLEGQSAAQLCTLSSCYLLSVALVGNWGAYSSRVRVEQMLLVVLKIAVGFAVIWLAMLSVAGGSLASWHFFVTYIVVVIFFVGLYRIVVRRVLISRRQHSSAQCRIVFLGCGGNIQELFDEMANDASVAFGVVGYFHDTPDAEFSQRCNYLGGVEDAVKFLAENSVQRVYCGLTSNHSGDIVGVMNYCESHMVRFYSVPNLRNYLRRRMRLEMLGSVPVLSMRNEPLAYVENRAVKRCFDVLFSLTFLVTIFPIVYIIVGVGVKLSSPGPVIFRQRRNGLDGKEFWCYKFRSMRVNSAADTLQASKDDPRKTQFGDFIRRTNLDELPQFISVLKGDMSVVGPRPHMLKHTQQYSQIISTYMVRHLIKPGVTGWAQVTGCRGETREVEDMERRVQADIWYIEHWTLLLDVYIIYKTVTNVLLRRDSNAY